MILAWADSSCYIYWGGGGGGGGRVYAMRKNILMCLCSLILD